MLRAGGVNRLALFLYPLWGDGMWTWISGSGS